MTAIDTSTPTGLSHLWPDHGSAASRTVTGRAGVAGLVGAVVLVGSSPGLGVLLTGLAVLATALPEVRRRLNLHVVAFLTLAVLLLAVVVVRDAPWLIALSLLGSVGTASYAVAPGRSLVAAVLGGLSLPLAGLRCLPWLGRGLRPARDDTAAALRSWLKVSAVTGLLLLVFGALFASADAAFAALVPRPDVGWLPLRVVVLVVVTGLAISAAFLSAAPPRWDVIAPGRGRSVRVMEWLVPIAVLDVVFAVFVGVQVDVLFGGNRHVVATAGLTYAEYARSGFGQLLVATILTLTVVAATVRWAPRDTRAERVCLRVGLGLLCALCLVVVGSAVVRLGLYEQAFGFTRLRLVADAIEIWLGVVITVVLVAGVRLQATWLPRAVVASAAAALLGLAVINPDAFVASHNIERFRSTGSLDVGYLQRLSADAVPALDSLPEPARSCVLSQIAPGADRGLGGLNLARRQARHLLQGRPTGPVDCRG